MSSIIKRIESMINSLPSKDIKLANTFLKRRDFESLKELIDSAIYKVKKSQISETPKPEYNNIDLDKLSSLKSEVDMYIVQLGVYEDNEYE